jgi:(E)-4-hydroxy-3-methylbut-2-enyl-diphosphate synthase
MKSFIELPYCLSLKEYHRRKSIVVNIGDVPMGGTNPIRIQSMTTVDTMDTEGSIAESIRMIDAGCEYIRITAPSIKEAENLANIKKGLKQRGYNTPLIADIHFTPNAAELAARLIEKVRINPGNYADKKKFDLIEYTDLQYEEEIARIRQKFVPLIKICKEYGTAMRIGTNHGSLSDRILSRYGDTPFGMVESALEFLRICEDQHYYNVVLSMKSSNPQVMVQAYRLLVARLEEEKLKAYPLHLGVTEAGEGEDGRVKSAMGIGTLLEDGLGDTVRVSLTENPEFEAPVARKIVARYQGFDQKFAVNDNSIVFDFNPYQYLKRKSAAVSVIGGEQLPKVIADFSNLEINQALQFKAIGHHYLSATDKWTTTDTSADIIYLGNSLPNIEIHSNLGVWCDAKIYNQVKVLRPCLPVFDTLKEASNFIGEKVVKLQLTNEVDFSGLKNLDSTIIWVLYNKELMYKEVRNLCFELKKHQIDLPIVFGASYTTSDLEQFQLAASTDLGGLFVDGYGDGISLRVGYTEEKVKIANSVAFTILQASRVRMSKTEYISCPSCGRTLFDLQETTAMIRKRTDHLKGVKIGIMGCIVNGPGEMADADYGYVGSGIGKITLYKGQEVVKRNVPAAKAVDELIGIIKEGGNWIEPNQLQLH